MALNTKNSMALKKDEGARYVNKVIQNERMYEALSKVDQIRRVLDKVVHISPNCWT